VYVKLINKGVDILGIDETLEKIKALCDDNNVKFLICDRPDIMSYQIVLRKNDKGLEYCIPYRDLIYESYGYIEKDLVNRVYKFIDDANIGSV